MRLFRTVMGGLVGLTFCIVAARADTPSNQPGDAGRSRNPARLLPEQTDLLVQVRRPRQIVQTLTGSDLLRQLRQFAPVRELDDSTNLRRFYQLVAYAEKELGASWPELLDRLAGRGAALGFVLQSLHADKVRFGVTPTAVLLVIEGDDDKLMRRFFELALKVVEQEMARKEVKGRPIKAKYEGIETVGIGDFHAAVAGGALLIGNTDKALYAGLDRHLGREKKSVADVPSVAEAAKLLPAGPLASFWLNMETVRQSPGAKAAYQPPPRDDPNATVILGHYFDLLGRTPFVCAGVYAEKDGFLATVRVPRGRNGMGMDRLLHVPPAGTPGSRPLLEPKNVLYSESSYLDISRIWTDRAKLFNEKQVQGLEKAANQTNPILGSVKISRLLPQVGPYYRFVAAHQEVSYKTKPKIAIPAFALVWELREPEAFDRSMGTILRSVALVAGAQADLKLAKEEHNGCKLTGYRFPDGKPLKNDVNDLRYNFSPCFTRVGDQFVVASTIELGRELVDLLKKEDTSPSRGAESTSRMRLYGSGAAAYLQTLQDLLVTQTTLDEAVSPDEARQQVKTFLDLIRNLGTLSLEPQFKDATFQYDLRLRPSK